MSAADGREPVAALQVALAAEHAAVYGYGVLGAHVSASQRGAAREAWYDHRQRRDDLRAFVSRHGASPEPASVAYRLPFPVDGPNAATRLAARLEDGAVDAYLGLVAIPDPELRGFAARALRECAARAAHWRGTVAAFPGLPPRAIYGSPGTPGRNRPG